MSNIILTSYFTTKPDPQAKKRKKLYKLLNNLDLIYDWVQSIINNNLYGIIFHDFEWELNLSERVIPIKYNLKTKWSINDERFLCYLNYIKEHKNIKNIFMTDLFDVQFYKDPFNLINKDYDLYIGQNKGILINENWYLSWGMMRAFKKIYYGNDLDLNAGVIGGSRRNIIKLLEHMISYFNFYNSKQNINMPVFNRSVYDLFKKEKLLVGFPVSSQFKKFELDGEFAIKHK
ncbi:hypothetical protein K9L16_04270 [Candidatus Pacearchaeota archaeon]|nr:hypothetical protein [Candidatus Pacearchaeota archaeon]